MKPSRFVLVVLALCACEQTPHPVVGPAPVPAPPAPPLANACRWDRECSPGEKCCGGACTQTECCSSGDCLGRVCSAGKCVPCASTADCAAGQVCCSGLCRAGACCADEQCPGGQRCHDFQCGACGSDGECGAGQKCCAGACVKGACCGGAECPSGLCDKNQCAACTADAQCGANKVCCKGACVLDGACELGLRLDCSPACPKGRLCCDGKCLLAQCCTDTDCAAYPSAPLCIDGACQKCTADSQCPMNTKCCSGACHPGACCPGQVCPLGKACLNYSCSDCAADADCGAGKRCCDEGGGSKQCISGGCCSDDDCAPYRCVAGVCSTCALDSDCLKGAKCCGGVCYAGGQCCSRADCAGGQICASDHACEGCTNGRQCGLGARCCNNECSLGSCCSNNDCQTATTGLVCSDGACQLCTSDAQCGGARCCSGKCVSGCCTDSDCGKGQQCKNGACGSCTVAPSDAGVPNLQGTCGFGQVCCPAGAGGQMGCVSGTCCGNSDCTSGGLVCDVTRSCSQCTAVLNAAGQYVSSNCSSGQRCCSGACYPGDCCTSADCSCGAELCINGKCTSCTADLDCGGGGSCCPSVDPSNPTKVCKPFCDSAQVWDEAADFDKGSYSGAGHSLTANQALDPDCTKSGYLCLAGASVWLGYWTVTYDSGTTANSLQPFFKALNVKAKIPANTGIAWRVRTSDSLSGLNNNLVAWSDWMAIVPTSADYATYPADLSYVPGVNNPTIRTYLEFELRLESSVANLTPVVDSIKLDWSPDDPLTNCPACGSGYFRCGGACCACETCKALGRSCGSINDRCGHTLLCGNCPTVPNGSNLCSVGGNACELVCNPGYNAVGTCCAASSCATLGKECNDWPDGCGGTLHCGIGVCPNPANGSGFCSPQGLCDVTCNYCWVRSSRSSCTKFVEVVGVSVTPSSGSVYVDPPGVANLYHSAPGYSAQASATTASKVTWSLSGQPAWLSINPATGALQGRPTNNATDPGTRTVTVIATTDCGNVGSTTTTINVLANQWCGDGAINGGVNGFPVEQCDPGMTDVSAIRTLLKTKLPAAMVDGFTDAYVLQLFRTACPACVLQCLDQKFAPFLGKGCYIGQTDPTQVYAGTGCGKGLWTCENASISCQQDPTRGGVTDYCCAQQTAAIESNSIGAFEIDRAVNALLPNGDLDPNLGSFGGVYSNTSTTFYYFNCDGVCSKRGKICIGVGLTGYTTSACVSIIHDVSSGCASPVNQNKDDCKSKYSFAGTSTAVQSYWHNPGYFPGYLGTCSYGSSSYHVGETACYCQ